jgi:hypothetical protein
MKQTAVEWLEEMMNVNGNISVYFQEILDQAKEMEKEQIMDAYDAGLFDGTMDDVNDRIHKQYYNETFKSE